MRASTAGLLLVMSTLSGTAGAVDLSVSCSSGASGLIAALNSVQGSVDAVNSITLQAPCNYVLSAVNNSAGDDGSPNGLPLVTKNLVIKGQGATISRDAAAPAFRLFWLTSSAVVELRDLQLVGGLAQGDAGHDAHPPGGTLVPGGSWSGLGGAIYSKGADLTITRCSFSANTARGGRGGNGYGGTYGGGGGAAMGGALFLDNDLFANNVLIDSSTFESNQAIGGAGGETSSEVGNTAGGGGGGLGGSGGFLVNGGAAGAPTDGEFGGGGGAAANTSGFLQGGAGGFGGGGGGGFQVAPGGPFGGNSANNSFSGGGGAGLGGAIFSNGPNLTMVNSTVSGNLAQAGNGGSGAQGGSAAGAGVFIKTGQAFVTYDTVVGNLAVGGDGGQPFNTSAFGGNASGANIEVNPTGEFLGGRLEIRNTVSTLGTVNAGHGHNAADGSATSADLHGSIVSVGYNLISVRGTSVGYIASDLPEASAVLSPLANNGGTTLTHLPLNGSPLRNAIPLAECHSSVDQRGSVRPLENGCEIGSVEAIVDTLFKNGFE